MSLDTETFLQLSPFARANFRIPILVYDGHMSVIGIGRVDINAIWPKD